MIVSFINNKGGVGKTTSAANFGAALRFQGFDVLLVDCDGQANLSFCFGITEQERTLGAVLKKGTPEYVRPVIVYEPDGTGGAMHVLPSCTDLSTYDIEQAQAKDRLSRLSAAMELYAPMYDVIILDTPPAMELLTVSAMFACDETIITMQPQFLAVKGLVTIAQTVAGVNAKRERPLVTSVLFTMYDRRKGLHRATVEQVEHSGVRMFKTVIRENISLAESPATGTDIFAYAPKSNGAQDYMALAEEFVQQRKLKHKKHRY